MGLRSLGKQHEGYGVKQEHYPLIRDVLLEVIGEELGDEFRPSLKIIFK